MTRLFAAAVLALSLAASAVAAPKSQPARIFLSPCGQPFRPSASDPDPLKAWFDQADANHDGAIDRAEFRADAANFFKTLDTNHDGVIDGFESQAYETKVVPELAAWSEGIDNAEMTDRHARRLGRHMPLGIAQLIDEPEPVTGADFNFDSHITLAEWMQATDQRFDMLDEAKSGRLTLPELREELAKAEKGKGR